MTRAADGPATRAQAELAEWWSRPKNIKWARYMKGPEDKPLVVKRDVFRVAR